MASNRPEAMLTLRDLCDRAGVTVRTVRYYISAGLLGQPERAGSKTRYPVGHLARLELIRKLKGEHLPLAEIRVRLERLDDGEVEALLAETAETGPPESAADYVRRVLGDRTSPTAPPVKTARASKAPRPAASSPEALIRSRWERIVLTPDVEIHVQRPLSRSDIRRVERLLEAAQRIFEVTT